MGSTNRVSGVELEVCSRVNVSSQLLEWLFHFIEKPYVSPCQNGDLVFQIDGSEEGRMHMGWLGEPRVARAAS